MKAIDISLTVNGEERAVSAYPMERLLDVLRNKLGLTGTKEGCGEGECGSCSVLMNGELVNIASSRYCTRKERRCARSRA